MQLTGYRRLRRTALYWVRGADDPFRRHTGARRALPDYVIIGGTICDTTSLFDWLSERDRRVGSVLREVYYAEQVKRVLNLFPNHQFLFIESETLCQSASATLDSVCKFVGAETLPRNFGFRPQNVGTHGRKVPPSMTDALTEYFRPHNRELLDLLGRRFDWSA